MGIDQMEDKARKIRHFNRFYTRKIGVLREGLLHSQYSLTETRILFELAYGTDLTASDLSRELGLDPGYVSRILSKFVTLGMINKTKSDKDERALIIKLTTKGKQEFDVLDMRSREEILELLNELTKENQDKLLKSMATIEEILEKKLKFAEPFFLRTHESGDMGWVAHRHGILYMQEYGWDEHFEALVAQIVSDFIKNFNPKKERCWIAEIQGYIVGSVFVVKDTETDAKLRLLLVEPKARGLGLGTRLVEECIRFSRRVGYKKLKLWTNDVLVDARNIYEKKGFQLVEKNEHHSFGHDLIGEYWQLELDRSMID
ncbi:MAG: bifunctional helix-turn-helix transcriptional regulator/GNAT family N-acetyltransferase [Candidatus Kariarchaeaceae archaeon]|jgi:DNA-binding MarR family transcriptional regulator/N-acetylglutamate synthase-like GNAT family acetyltransferase